MHLHLQLVLALKVQLSWTKNHFGINIFLQDLNSITLKFLAITKLHVHKDCYNYESKIYFWLQMSQVRESSFCLFHWLKLRRRQELPFGRFGDELGWKIRHRMLTTEIAISIKSDFSGGISNLAVGSDAFSLGPWKRFICFNGHIKVKLTTPLGTKPSKLTIQAQRT